MLERFAIGLVGGLFGFLTGAFAWWLLSGIPELDFGWRAYLYLSCALGILSFLGSLWRPEATVDLLGLLGQKLWSFSLEVLSWFRRLR